MGRLLALPTLGVTHRDAHVHTTTAYARSAFAARAVRSTERRNSAAMWALVLAASAARVAVNAGADRWPQHVDCKTLERQTCVVRVTPPPISLLHSPAVVG